MRWVQGELLKFRPLDFGPDKDDAVPMVRKADRGRCDGGPVGTTYNGPMSLTRTDVKRGPNSHRPPPAGTPAPHLIRFRVLGPPFGGASAEAECDGFRAEAFQISALGVEPKERCPFLCRLRWRPATASFPRSRSIHCDELSGGEGKARAAQSVECTPAR